MESQVNTGIGDESNVKNRWMETQMRKARHHHYFQGLLRPIEAPFADDLMLFEFAHSPRDPETKPNT